LYFCPDGGMVDARDLKSLGSYELCEFESHSGHQEELIWLLKDYSGPEKTR
jgi:hypothetical protein